MEGLREFFSQVLSLARQVNWPDKESLVELTVVVILFSIVVGTILVGADLLFTKLVGWLTVG